jgi:hypothetical protein
MQIGDGHAAVPGGADASKVRCVRHVPGTDFGAPGAMLANADADRGQARGGAWRGGC